MKCLPHTVQTLDTGELVAAAYRLLVPHPPGFPLYIWLQHLFTHLVQMDTVFWRASLFSLLLSLGVLGLLGFHGSWLYLTGCLIPLGLMQVFWKYSVLPDVFMLNVFFLTLLLSCYFYMAPSKKKICWLFFIWAIGLLNHPTLIFAFPILIEACYKQISVKEAIGLWLGAFLIVFIGYCSLLLLHTGDLYSWGYLRNLTQVINHALRKEYGTFHLADSNIQLPVTVLLHSWIQMMLNGVPMAAILCLVPLFSPSKEKTFQRRYYATLFVLVFYLIIFLSRSNVHLISILERFYLLPAVLVVFLARSGISSLEGKLSCRLKSVLGIVAISMALGHFIPNFSLNNFSKNTIIEDWALNFLSMPADKDESNNIFIVNGDTRCFSLRYVQQVLNFKKNALVFCHGNLFFEDQFFKIAQIRPDFKLSPDWKHGPNKRNVLKHMVDPNQERLNFIFDQIGFDDKYQITIMGLGRKFSKGSGVYLDRDSLNRLSFRSNIQQFPSNVNFHEYKNIYGDYALFYLGTGSYTKDEALAIKEFEKALQIVPYCSPAIDNICLILKQQGKDTTQCEQRRQLVYSHDDVFFDENTTDPKFSIQPH